ncbi:hypothetical protein ABIE26_004800 [Pedobacter africanus]|uniref:Uncharacterized protein n=1 Tax=Pedobacter africanus TaxID=151894 RepID=A0ACC6L310_9SPHI|nr:RagB/SusD family nutrient uptake outer membrane protein [Pedobacter africanus]MDR6785731.1 hypothetical protein [Pedobacter africanus]
MNRYKYFIALACLIMPLLFTGCKKALQQEPKASNTVKNAWKNEADANAELAAAYSLFRSPLTTLYGHYAYGDFRTGDVRNSAAFNLERNDLGSSQYAVDYWRDWSRFYKAIAQCNLILERITEIPESSFTDLPRQHYVAETRFVRALSYFYLARIWGDVPLNTLGINRDPLKRSDMNEVLEFALQDLDAGYADLPWAYASTTLRAVRATKPAVLALKAHIYMWKKEEAKAEAACKTLMDNEGLSKLQLLPFSRMAEVMKGKSAEGIFEVNFNGSEAAKYSTLGSSFARPPEVSAKPGEYSTIPSAVANELFPPQSPDLRGQWLANRSNSEDIVLNKFNIKASDFTPTAPKYEANISLFRYADLILLRAEALVKLSRGAEAIPLLNRVRSRANATLYDAVLEPDLAFAILQERRKELIGEGHRWYDLVRNNRVPAYNIYITDADASMGAVYWPVSAAAFQNNPLMTQSFYWSK